MDRFQGINAFVAVVESGSFRCGAELLGLTASAISKSIARLEANLGVRLLHRTTRSLTLTEEGTAYFENCQRILRDLTEAGELASRKRGTVAGRLHIHVPHTFAHSFLIPALPAFTARYPQLELRLSLADNQPDMIEERIDIAIHVGEITDKRLVAQRLRGSRGITAASPGYFAAHGTPNSIEALDQHDCVLFIEPGAALPWPWMFGVKDELQHYRPRPRLLANSNTAVLEAAVAGLGIIQSADYVLERPIAKGKLVPILAPFEIAGPPIQMLWPRDRFPSARMKAFIEWVETLA
jgi:LysR family transcriptional regulator for bpeEF and oprC